MPSATTGTDRRAFLQGTLGMAALPWLCRVGAPRSDRALIVIWLDGGLSHIDSFDPKPEATLAIRGELDARATALDGVRISAHLPRLAERLDRVALLRSLTHNEGNHDRGSHYLLTGHRPSPVVVHPSLGAVLASRSAVHGLPPYVALPTAPTYAGAGFLPGSARPFAVGGDPGRPEFRVSGLAPTDPVAGAGVTLVDALDELDGAPRSAAETTRDALVAQARALREDPEVRAAFDLRAESGETRARYGRHRLGQSCLLARRLVAAGTRVAFVHDPGWDHHVNIARALTYGFPPKLEALDQAVAALLDDLRDQGLDERVTVLVASEFGRTPRLNPSGGRDHWPRAQSVLLAGAGVRPGVVVGATDPRGEEPDGSGHSPGDLFATLVHILGLDWKQRLTTNELGRPIPLVEDRARPIRGLLA